MGGLGVPSLDKFATALRLRWLWNEWAEQPKPWVGLGTPCTEADRDLFAAATRVMVGNEDKACFWTSPWLDGLRPMDIAPKIFEISKKKDSSVRKALTDDLWISQVDMVNGITVGHIQEFTIL